MPPRVAYFPDSFHEVNGVAHTSRNFVAYARNHAVPMLCVRAGNKTKLCTPDGCIEALELARSPLSIPMESDLYFDPFFFRHLRIISKTVRKFRPDIIHITGPSELGMLGAYLAWRLKVPLVASWHTNVHEYAARRMGWLTQHLSTSQAKFVEAKVEAWMFFGMTAFYRRAKVLYAPNPALCTLLETKIGRRCHLMRRGVDTAIFSPGKRTRQPDDRICTLGYVGRLSVEKNVALLPLVDAALRAHGIQATWLIVGHGSEDAMLRAGLERITMSGILRGEDLAEAYANMDLLVFPSHTDTFGNVVLEALSSGVPAVVTPDGGPASLVQDGCTGSVATDENFATAIEAIFTQPESLGTMRVNARDYAMQCSWDTVFERVIAAYPTAQT